MNTEQRCCTSFSSKVKRCSFKLGIPVCYMNNHITGPNADIVQITGSHTSRLSICARLTNARYEAQSSTYYTASLGRSKVYQHDIANYCTSFILPTICTDYAERSYFRYPNCVISQHLNRSIVNLTILGLQI